MQGLGERGSGRHRRRRTCGLAGAGLAGRRPPRPTPQPPLAWHARPACPAHPCWQASLQHWLNRAKRPLATRGRGHEAARAQHAWDLQPCALQPLDDALPDHLWLRAHVCVFWEALSLAAASRAPGPDCPVLGHGSVQAPAPQEPEDAGRSPGWLAERPLAPLLLTAGCRRAAARRRRTACLARGNRASSIQRQLAAAEAAVQYDNLDAAARCSCSGLITGS